MHVLKPPEKGHIQDLTWEGDCMNKPPPPPSSEDFLNLLESRLNTFFRFEEGANIKFQGEGGGVTYPETRKLEEPEIPERPLIQEIKWR